VLLWSCYAVTERNRAGNVDLGSSKPHSPSRLRRNSTPVDGDGPDEEVGYIGQGAQSTWGVSDKVDEEVAEYQTLSPVAASRKDRTLSKTGFFTALGSTNRCKIDSVMLNV
jgi:hypothetical protein